MKEEKLFEIIKDIDEKYIAEAISLNKNKPMNKWAKWIASAACLFLIFTGIALYSRNTQDTGTGEIAPGGNIQELNEEMENDSLGESVPSNTANADTETGLNPDIPVQNEISIHNTFDDICGGSYLDEYGKWNVWLVPNNLDNQTLFFENNPQIREDNVIFKEGDYSLAYLNELLKNISEDMSIGKLPYVSLALVSEQTNRVEVYMTSEDERHIKIVKSFDTVGGAIVIKKGESAVEDLGR